MAALERPALLATRVGSNRIKVMVARLALGTSFATRRKLILGLAVDFDDLNRGDGASSSLRFFGRLTDNECLR